MNQEEILVPCPHCKNDNSITPVNRIEFNNGSFQRLLKGDLNVFICLACSSKYSYNTPLYSYLEPYSTLVFLNESLENLDREIINSLSEELLNKFIAKKKDKHYSFRMTTNRNSFIEKIFLINNSFNDKLIEYLKFQIYCKKKEYKFPRYRFFYDYSNKDKSFLQLCVFDEQDNKISTKLQVQKSLYTELLEQYNKNTLKLDDFFSLYFVDVESFFLMEKKTKEFY